MASGRSRRRKGGDGERAAAKLLARIWPSAKRGVGQTQAGNNCADVEGTPYWVECKWRKVTNIEGAMRQAQAETDGRPCLVVSKRTRQPILVTMDWATFEALAKGENDG